MHLWLKSLLSVALVSALSLLGLLTLPFRESSVRRLSDWLVSFAVGALLGDAFIHLIPAAFLARGANTLSMSSFMLAGLLLFFVLEKLLHRREHVRAYGDKTLPPIAVVNLLGDGVHNFIDGVLIGASYLTNTKLGLTTTLAVMVHEIPHELGDFAVLIHCGLSVRKASLWNLASALVAILGTTVTLLFGTTYGSQVSAALVPFAAGGFVYVAAADLVPELQRDRSPGALLKQVVAMALGIRIDDARRVRRVIVRANGFRAEEAVSRTSCAARENSPEIAAGMNTA